MVPVGTVLYSFLFAFHSKTVDGQRACHKRVPYVCESKRWTDREHVTNVYRTFASRDSGQTESMSQTCTVRLRVETVDSQRACHKRVPYVCEFRQWTVREHVTKQSEWRLIYRWNATQQHWQTVRCLLHEVSQSVSLLLCVSAVLGFLLHGNYGNLCCWWDCVERSMFQLCVEFGCVNWSQWDELVSVSVSWLLLCITDSVLFIACLHQSH